VILTTQGSKQLKPPGLAGLVVHVCYPSTWEVETVGREFQASLGYIARTFLKKKKKKSTTK
jgi:hypothetical protein